MILISTATSSFYVLIAVGVEDVRAALVVAPVFQTMFILFAGFFLTEVPPYWIWMTWACSAFSVFPMLVELLVCETNTGVDVSIRGGYSIHFSIHWPHVHVLFE